MSYKGYHFFVGDLELPYAPSELKVVIGSNNTTVDLINGSPINILKNPKLTEIEFEIELPRGRQYAFANKLVSSKTYTDYFEKLMLNRTPTKLVITRPNPRLRGSTGIGGTSNDFESTVLTVSLEGYDMTESAENAYDIKVSLKFKEYVTYGTVVQKKKNPVTPTPKPKPIVKKQVEEKKYYVVKSGDCLWNIARKYYGVGTKWPAIYEANKQVIEKTARKYGRKSSSNGHWIYTGTKLIIPNLK